MGALAKALLAAGLGYVGWKIWEGVKGPQTEAEKFNEMAESIRLTEQQALFAKARQAPLSLTQDEIKLFGTLDPDGLGEVLAGLTQEDRARFQAVATGAAYSAPDAPHLAQPVAENTVDPNFMGPPVPPV